MAKIINPLGAMTHEAIEGRVDVAKAVCGLCGAAWEAAYVAAAIEAIPEPASWKSLHTSHRAN